MPPRMCCKKSSFCGRRVSDMYGVTRHNSHAKSHGNVRAKCTMISQLCHHHLDTMRWDADRRDRTSGAHDLVIPKVNATSLTARFPDTLTLVCTFVDSQEHFLADTARIRLEIVPVRAIRGNQIRFFRRLTFHLRLPNVQVVHWCSDVSDPPIGPQHDRNPDDSRRSHRSS